MMHATIILAKYLSSKGCSGFMSFFTIIIRIFFSFLGFCIFALATTNADGWGGFRAACYTTTTTTTTLYPLSETQKDPFPRGVSISTAILSVFFLVCSSNVSLCYFCFFSLFIPCSMLRVACVCLIALVFGTRHRL